ncbi:SusC/RagA family TonB-linked outer membrane protein [Pedobacter sp. MW01-1-1]|uniref:SusC/RagA family TonB-linked outer membrane protein n=1 Tax=Pedobacter sp. MW01-1-1 TaxID=3383027 RepID=UPI003FEE72C3
MKLYTHSKVYFFGNIRSSLRIMKLTILLITLGFLQVNAHTFAQKVSINVNNSTLKNVLVELKKQTGLNFVYTENSAHKLTPISVNIQSTKIEQALDEIFANQPLTYTINNGTIVIIEKEVGFFDKMKNFFAKIDVSGTVLDEDGNPLPGATIRVKGTTLLAVTNGNGEFTIRGVEEGAIISITYQGYVAQTIKAKEKLRIKMVPNVTDMKDVVITGTGITRNRNSFTGATSNYTGEELRNVSTGNIIQSLKTLDPSFVQIENNLAGSNPNNLPTIELRGTTSIQSNLKDEFSTDPNQPLFILDGFETTLQIVVDLDVNRIASVTILKDAASTALYGSKASNGVVVIETLQPKTGELRFSYTNDLRIELPDLSSYNLMNAQEKLQFELLSGRYTTNSSNVFAQYRLDDLYNTHLKAVQRGVDTYWLAEPLQTGITENNSIFAEGGDNSFKYGLGLNYKSLDGVMKGSGRDTWNANVNLTYRKGKLNIQNVTYIRGYKAFNSPYGNFSDYVALNPYYEKDPSIINLETGLQSNNLGFTVGNPLYDAVLPNKDESSNFQVQNNLNLRYDINAALKISVGLQVSKAVTETTQFVSPDDSQFINTIPTLRGTYSNKKLNNNAYTANGLITYGKVFGGKHSVTANLRSQISNNQNSSLGFSAVGYPSGSTGNPAFAYSYATGGAPNAYTSIVRSLDFVGSANYAFDRRFLADLSYRLDGSTVFGSDKQFSPFWSAGLGWNINNEKFLTSSSWINRLKLYANIGTTGNQNYGGVTTESIYAYSGNTNYNQFGNGISLTTLGNSQLAPQKTQQISAGIDFQLFHSRLSGNFEAYNKVTNPLVVAVDLPSSTGLDTYPLNAGQLTINGFESSLKYIIINQRNNGIIWSVNANGKFNKKKYDKFGETLANLNKAQAASGALTRYTDGASPDDLWSRISLGIDPATGNEVFLTPTGGQSFEYSDALFEVVGTRIPKVEGTFGTNFSYKNFTLGVYMRYQFGGDIFNTALYNKVENISFAQIVYNQDKRALYDRWQNPGDITQFKAVQNTSSTPISSRFVQRNNTISGESLSMGYNFRDQKWLKSVSLKSLSLTCIANDIFYISTIQRERGTDYPFSRVVSFSLRASF